MGRERKGVRNMRKFPGHWVSSSSLTFVELHQICFLFLVTPFEFSSETVISDHHRRREGGQTPTSHLWFPISLIWWHVVLFSQHFLFSFESSEASQTNATQGKPPGTKPPDFLVAPCGRGSAGPRPARRGGAGAGPPRRRHAPRPPRRLIRTRGAAGVKSCPASDGPQPPSEPRPRRRCRPEPRGAPERRRSRGGSRAPLCARRGGFASRTYFAHKDWELGGGGCPRGDGAAPRPAPTPGSRTPGPPAGVTAGLLYGGRPSEHSGPWGGGCCEREETRRAVGRAGCAGHSASCPGRAQGPGVAGPRRGDPGPEGCWAAWERGARAAALIGLLLISGPWKWRDPSWSGISRPPGAPRAVRCRALGARLAPRCPGRLDTRSGPREPPPGQTKEGPRGDCPAGFKMTVAVFAVCK